MDIVRKIIEDTYNNSYSVLENIQRDRLFTINKYEISTSKSIIFRGRKIFADKNKKFVIVPIHYMKSKDINEYTVSLFLDKTSIISMINENSTKNFDIFIDGERLNYNIEAYFTEEYMYYMIDDTKSVSNATVIEYRYTNKMYSYDANTYSSIDVSGYTEDNIMVYASGMVKIFSVVNDMLIIENIEDEVIDIVIDKYMISRQFIDSDHISLPSTNNPISTHNILSFTSSGLFTDTNTFSYESNGEYNIDSVFRGYVIAYYYNGTDRYTYRDYTDDYISYNGNIDNIPDTILNKSKISLSISERNNTNNEYSSMNRIITHDPNVYRTYLDSTLLNYFKIDIDNDPYVVMNNLNEIEDDSQYIEFNNERVLIKFANPDNKMYAIYYNGVLQPIEYIYGMNIHNMEYVYIMTSNLDGLNNGTFEVQLRDSDYMRIDKIVSEDDDCIISITPNTTNSIVNMRFFKNGIYIPRKYIRYEVASAIFGRNKVIFKLDVKVGDILTIEDFSKVMPENFISSTLSSNGVLNVNVNNINRPLSLKYMDIFVNGKRIYEEDIISNGLTQLKSTNSLNEVYIFDTNAYDLDVYNSIYRRSTDIWDNYVKSDDINKFIEPLLIDDSETYYNSEPYDTYMLDHHVLYETQIKDNIIYATPTIENYNEMINTFSESNSLYYDISVFKLDASETMINLQKVSNDFFYIEDPLDESGIKVDSNKLVICREHERIVIMPNTDEIADIWLNPVDYVVPVLPYDVEGMLWYLISMNIYGLSVTDSEGNTYNDFDKVFESSDHTRNYMSISSDTTYIKTCTSTVYDPSSNKAKKWDNGTEHVLLTMDLNGSKSLNSINYNFRTNLVDTSGGTGISLVKDPHRVIVKLNLVGGGEYIAYDSGWLYSAIPEIDETSLLGGEGVYLDAESVVFEAWLPRNTNLNDWKTVDINTEYFSNTTDYINGTDKLVYHREDNLLNINEMFRVKKDIGSYEYIPLCAIEENDSVIVTERQEVTVRYQYNGTGSYYNMKAYIGLPDNTNLDTIYIYSYSGLDVGDIIYFSGSYDLPLE